MISAQNGAPIPHDTVLFGEIGLGGEIRPVPQPGVRLNYDKKEGYYQRRVFGFCADEYEKVLRVKSEKVRTPRSQRMTL